ncbi:hypothetical protein VNO78_13026 [Psophocarpus tetragonolobus]|uniref:TF-B3 domain-containing protein n=1 Tax=Psophocarpus tetragonolobus TaxID=3891 RepID=A0AAN9SRU3_PSOTE
MQPHGRRNVEKVSKHFLKIILPSPIHADQMRIPKEFLKRFGDELSTVATISVPDGRVWKMRLKKCGKDVLFCSQWREFVKYYSLHYGSHLVFRYEGNSKFHVLIFDITSAEIYYPCKTGGTDGESNLESRSRKKSKVDVNSKSQNQNPPRKKQSCCCHEKQVKFDYSETENYSCWEIAKNDSAIAKTKNPSVTSTIRTCNLYVPSKFAGKYLKPKVWMMLQNCNGEQWVVSCINHTGSSGAMLITRGWIKFVRDNHLSEGDPCELELIKNNPVVLKLTLL